MTARAESWEGSTWGEILAGTGFIHRNWPDVVRLAEAAGKEPGQVTAIWLSNAPAEVLPVLMFADGSMVSMEGEGRI